MTFAGGYGPAPLAEPRTVEAADPESRDRVELVTSFERTAPAVQGCTRIGPRLAERSNVHVAAAASPRLVSAEYPRGSRGVAATRFDGKSTWRRRRDPPRRYGADFKRVLDSVPVVAVHDQVAAALRAGGRVELDYEPGALRLTIWSSGGSGQVYGVEWEAA